MNNWNCKVRLKSTKDGKITAIHRNNPKKENMESVKRVIESVVNANMTMLMITGFTEDGMYHTAFSHMDSRGDGLLAIENLKAHFNNTPTEE